MSVMFRLTSSTYTCCCSWTHNLSTSYVLTTPAFTCKHVTCLRFRLVSLSCSSPSTSINVQSSQSMSLSQHSTAGLWRSTFSCSIHSIWVLPNAISLTVTWSSKMVLHTKLLAKFSTVKCCISAQTNLSSTILTCSIIVMLSSLASLYICRS